ncbi:hypothetical protein, partial [Escherichia coli]
VLHNAAKHIPDDFSIDELRNGCLVWLGNYLKSPASIAEKTALRFRKEMNKAGSAEEMVCIIQNTLKLFKKSLHNIDDIMAAGRKITASVG